MQYAADSLLDHRRKSYANPMSNFIISLLLYLVILEAVFKVKKQQETASFCFFPLFLPVIKVKL